MKTITKIVKCSFLYLLPMAVVALGVGVQSVHAAKFGVRVVDQLGKPVAGAAVCVGLQGNYKQFGALFTDSDGNAMVEVPNMPLLVTVSKDRFTGLRMSEPARGFNLLKKVKLIEGVPGPRCKAGSILAQSIAEQPAGGLHVEDIMIRDGVYSKVLQPKMKGKEPSHYRVSDTSDFSNTDWKTYSSQIALNGTLSDADKVFLQLRSRVGTSTNWIESQSGVMTIRLRN